MSQAPTAHGPYEQEPPEQAPAPEIRVIDPGAPHLAFTWQARDGHGRQASGQVAGAPPEPVCDFCASQPATYRYSTRRDGIIPVGGVVVVLPGGDWFACPACHLLVEAQLWDTLSTRARLSAEHGAVLWAYFRECRSGPAVPLDAPQRGDVE